MTVGLSQMDVIVTIAAAAEVDVSMVGLKLRRVMVEKRTNEWQEGAKHGCQQQPRA